MSQFGDAWHLVHSCEEKLAALSELHGQCLAEHSIKSSFLIEIKNFVENLRSALDYCARALFAKFGRSKKVAPRVYFPYAKLCDDCAKFLSEIVERSIPGLVAARPDIVDQLASYQHFGNSGNWLLPLMDITNENKHERLTPQVQKQYKTVRIRGTVPAGGNVSINLSKISLGGGPDKPFHAVAGTWRGLEFADTGVLVMLFLGLTLSNVRRVVEEISSLCGETG